MVHIVDFIRAGAARLRRFGSAWLTGRRALGTAGLLALVLAAAVLGLATLSPHPAHPGAPSSSRADTPAYLLPVGTLVTEGVLPRPALRGDDGSKDVPPGTKPVATARTTGDVSDRGSAIAPYRGAVGTLTPADLATLAVQAGCSPRQAVIATAVAMAESGGSPSAQGDLASMDATWDWSAGLWQIRGLRAERGTGAVRDSAANHDAVRNAAAMYAVSSGCSDWRPWPTYTDGTYAAYLTIATEAVRYVVNYHDTHGHHYPPVHEPDPNATVPTQDADTGDNSMLAAGHGSAASSPQPTDPAASTAGASPAADPDASGAHATSSGRPSQSPRPPPPHRAAARRRGGGVGRHLEGDRSSTRIRGAGRARGTTSDQCPTAAQHGAQHGAQRGARPALGTAVQRVAVVAVGSSLVGARPLGPV